MAYCLGMTAIHRSKSAQEGRFNTMNQVADQAQCLSGRTSQYAILDFIDTTVSGAPQDLSVPRERTTGLIFNDSGFKEISFFL